MAALKKGMPEEQKSGLIAGIYEGIYGNIMFYISMSFLAVYALELGASNVLIGIIVALPAAAAVPFYIPAAYLITRVKSRRNVCFVSSMFSRFWWIPAALIPFAVTDSSLWIPALVVTVTLYSVGSSFNRPSWSSLMADMIPLGERGKYFAVRNKYAILFSIMATGLCGVILDVLPGFQGFFLVFTIAGISGLAGALYFRGFPDIKSRYPKFNVLRGMGETLKNRMFSRFLMIFAFWNFGFYFSSPFFNVYLVENLNAAYSWIGILFLVTGVSMVIVQKFWGRVSDTFGHRSILIISSLSASTVPLWWALVPSPEFALLVAALGGLSYAGFSIASFNYMLDVSHGDRVVYSAVFYTLSEVPVVIAPVAGGFLADRLPSMISLPFSGLQSVFLVSWILSLSAALLFLKMLIEVPTRVRKSTANVTSEILSIGYQSVSGEFDLLGRKTYYGTKNGIRFMLRYVKHANGRLKRLGVEMPRKVRSDVKRVERDIRKYEMSEYSKLRKLHNRMVRDLVKLNRLRVRHREKKRKEEMEEGGKS